MQRIHIVYVSFSVLEARIQQLQSDVLDVQPAKVHFIKVPSGIKGVSSDTITSRGLSQVKAHSPKYGLLKKYFKPQPNRWMEKLTLEKKSKRKKLRHVKKTFKQISTEISSASANRSGMKLSDKVHATVSSPTTVSAVTTEKSATSNKLFIKKWKISKKSSKNDGKDITAKEIDLCEVEELAKIFNEIKCHSTVLGAPETTEDANPSQCGDIQLSILSYLEACVFMGDIKRSHDFLLSQHRPMSRRKHLSTDIYNIMMKVWAKKVSDEIKINETAK